MAAFFGSPPGCVPFVKSHQQQRQSVVWGCQRWKHRHTFSSSKKLLRQRMKGMMRSSSAGLSDRITCPGTLAR